MPEPRISVLMPAYNAERYIRQSVASVLGQTTDDFELLVVDDCSTDATADLLAAIRDRRIRVIRNDSNLGIVGALNRGFAEARGRYVARIDADDLCLPTRLAKQAAFLDEHREVALLGTEMSVLDGGSVRRSRQPADPDPLVLRWQFYTSNPIGHPSMMFRASVVEALGGYLRASFQYAEDFDFSHRVLQRGVVAVLPEFLVIYRRHEANLTRTRQAEMVAATAAILHDAYRDLLGGECAGDALIAAEHLVAGLPVQSVAAMDRLGALLNRLVDAFLARHAISDESADRVSAHASRLWWATVQNSLRAGTILPAAFGSSRFRGGRGRPGLHRLARSAVAGATGLRPLRRIGGAAARDRDACAQAGITLKGVRFVPEPIRHDDPPTLYVVVDTEAEFDWGKPFDRAQTKVSAMASQWRAQVMFDRYGLRPVYVVDYAVASQAEGYEPLRAFLDRDACMIGAHLHPWINPPFEETVSELNSFAGNLPADLEEQKLRALVAMIERSFGVPPLFFKAGRYGIGRNTMQALARNGLVVDFSIMPRTDLTSKGGVDFRRAQARPYRVAPDGLLSVPMTRGQLGLIPRLSPALLAHLQSPMMTALRLPAILPRLGMGNTVTLTPEGVTASEQIRLVRAMVRQGYRTFTMHYHSPSLMPGHTQYVRSEAELATFLRRIEEVCRFFFDDLGGMPGNPADLLPPGMREMARRQPAPHERADAVVGVG